MAKKFAPRNPKGINQFPGTKSEKTFTFRLEKELDEKVREYCSRTGITQTQFWEQLAKDFFSIE